MEVQTSRSVVVKKFGDYSCLSVEDFALPKLEDYVEVKVEYAGLNFADLYTRQGLMLNKKVPFVLGMECTGTVIAVKTSNTDLEVGQKVICYDYEGGMYRDLIRVSPNKCYKLPEFVDTKTGASIFVNYLTAYFSLITLGSLKEEEKVLILSCAGGVGCAATQIGKTIKNVKIYGTGSESKEVHAKENGVDIFYSNDTFKEKVMNEKFDLILTNEAGGILTFLQDLLNPLGRIILIGANNIIQNEKKLSVFSLIKAWWSTKYISPESLIVHNRVVAGLHLGTLSESSREVVTKALNYIFQLYQDGKIVPKIHAVLPMADIVEATKFLGERKNVGKILISMEGKSD